MTRYLPLLSRAVVGAFVLSACAADAPRGEVDASSDVADTDRVRPDAHGGADVEPADTTGDADAAPDASDDVTADAGDDVAPDVVLDVADDAAADVPGDAADVDPDAPADVATDVAVDAPDVVSCPPETGAWTGVLVEDVDGGTLEVDDVVRVTVNVHAPTPGDDASWLVLRHLNLEADRASATLDGTAVTVPGSGDRWSVPLPDTRDHVVVYEATVRSSDALVVVLSSFERTESGCPEPRSRSGALFQIAGGEIKTSSCVDMADYRSLQVAPVVPRQDTGAYEAANGVRDDLRAEGLIYCPPAPKSVHAAAVCRQRSGDQRCPARTMPRPAAASRSTTSSWSRCSATTRSSPTVSRRRATPATRIGSGAARRA